MPRKPDTPCSGCGKLLWRGAGSLTMPTCLSCRRRSPRPYGRRDGDGPLAALCLGCGKTYTARSLGRRGRLGACSRPCGQRLRFLRSPLPPRTTPEQRRAAANARSRRKRARRRGARSEPYTLADIAKRDRYRCGLCRKRVAMTKAVPHPKAPTIDHVVPLSKGGDDTRANVQLAHFACNISKNNRGGGEQLRLIG